MPAELLKTPFYGYIIVITSSGDFSSFYNSPSQEMIKVRVPLYERTTFSRFEIMPGINVHMMEVIDFLKWLVMRDQLRIASFLEKMDQNPFFLIAGAGRVRVELRVAWPARSLVPRSPCLPSLGKRRSGCGRQRHSSG